MLSAIADLDPRTAPRNDRGEPDPEWQRAWEALQLSRERRLTYRRRHRLALVAKLCALAACAGSALALGGAGVGVGPIAVAVPSSSELALDSRQALALVSDKPPVRSVPRRADIRRARAFAAERDGLVAFAVIDSRGRPHGYRRGALFPAASVVKAPLLAARLRGLEEAGERLDEGERGRLEAMIRWSDNDAADAVYGSVGDPALIETARRAGMRRFTLAGHWGNAQLTAAGAARFMSNLPRVLDGPHRRYAMGLLASVIPEQRWGIPEVASKWRIWLKGGWTDTRRGELVSQAALLKRGGRRIAVAILTDAQPSQQYGRHTLRGIAARLLGRRRGG
jgi:hypothetical protein